MFKNNDKIHLLIVQNLTAGGAQTNTTRSSSLGDARPQTPAGIAGLSSPGFEDIFGAMQDTNSLNQMLQNPAVTQMMQSLLSNPQYMNQVLIFYVLIKVVRGDRFCF